MAVKIRLAKVGRRNAPAFKIVATNRSTKRYGHFLDILGHYNPSHNPPSFNLDEEKLNEWVQKGAQVSDAVKQLQEGTYKFKPYNPNAKEETPATASEEKAKETEKTPVEDETTEAEEETA